MADLTNTELQFIARALLDASHGIAALGHSRVTDVADVGDTLTEGNSWVILLADVGKACDVAAKLIGVEPEGTVDSLAARLRDSDAAPEIERWQQLRTEMNAMRDREHADYMARRETKDAMPTADAEAALVRIFGGPGK